MSLHIALWSGPNLAAGAVLRAFEARTDVHVTDSPLYGHYLARTGADHPDAERLIGELETDWREAVRGLDGPAPDRAPVWVQHHMPHHLTFEVERDWLSGFRHVFLVQNPRAQIAWLVDRLGHVRIEDTGIAHMVEVFRWVRRTTGRTPVVLTVEQLLAAPSEVLEALCDRVGLRYDPAMATWPGGARPADSPWAEHWSDLDLHGFPPPCGACARGEVDLPAGYEDLARRCAPLHAELELHKVELLVH